MRCLPLLALLLTACPPPTDGNKGDSGDTDVTDADTDTDTDSDTDADSDTDTDTDTDADSDTDTDTDTDTDVDVCANDDDGDGYSVTDGDCYPYDDNRHPGANEECNGRDDDCDGEIDEDGVCTWATAFAFAPDTGAVDTGATADTATSSGGGVDTGADTGVAEPPPMPDTGGGTDTGVVIDTGVVVDTGVVGHDTGDTASSDTATADTGDTGTPGWTTDDDHDGYSEADGDCNDDARAGGRRVYPGAPDTCDDGIDEDCDGVDDACPPTAEYGYGADLSVCDADTFGAGHFFEDYLTEAGDSACTVAYDWVDSGASAARGCPDCEWAFNLEMQASTEAGPYCDDFGADFRLDGYTFDWGFSLEGEYYGYTLEDVVWLGYGGSWYPFAFNSSEFGYYMVEGDENHFEMSRPVSGYYYYYYP